MEINFGGRTVRFITGMHAADMACVCAAIHGDMRFITLFQNDNKAIALKEQIVACAPKKRTL